MGEGGDEVSVARFIADQRTNYRVPHTITCLLLGVSLAWFYKWRFRFRSSRISAASDRDWPGLGTMPSFQAALPGKPDQMSPIRAIVPG